MAKQFEIRNSTAKFLIFAIEGKEDGIQVMYRDETIWKGQRYLSLLTPAGVAMHPRSLSL